MNLYLLFLIAYIHGLIPITEQVKAKFKLVEMPEPPRKTIQLKQYVINDLTYKYNKLGSANDLIVNQVKVSNDGTLKLPELTVTSMVTKTSTISKLEESTEAPILYKIRATKRYIKDFLKFKDAQVVQQTYPNPKLTTSIKNYDHSLNRIDDLKAFISKIVQERVEDNDFDDYNFKQYGIGKSMTPSLRRINFDPKLQMHEFVNYLVKYEGFDFEDLKFLLASTELDFGLDELDDQLNTIKDEQDKRKIIDIIGDNKGITVSVSFMILVCSIVLSGCFI